MKWLFNKSLFKEIITIALIILLMLLIVIGIDFIKYKIVFNIAKQNIPIGGIGQPPIYIKGFGYIPFVWRGDFRRISIMAKGTSKNIGDLTYVVLQIGNHEAFTVDLKNGYGDFHSRELTEDDFRERNTWYEQDFKDAIVYVKLTPVRYDNGVANVKALVFMETEENHWLREINFKMTYHSCGGGYWYGGYAK